MESNGVGCRVKGVGCRVKGVGFKKILIVRLDRIGDVVLSTPVIKALRDACPESHIAFMVRPYTADLVKNNPYLNEVIIYDKEGPERGLLGNLKFIWALAWKRFDIAIILHPTARAHIVTFFSGIPRRIGYDKKMGSLLTKRIPHTKQLGLKHESDYSLDILSYIGIETEEKMLCVPVNAESECRIGELFAKNGINGQDTVIVVNPGASCPSKRWRPENFAKVSDTLAERYDAKIVIISDSRDKYFADSVSKEMKAKSLNLAGLTAVKDLASVFKRSDLFISNDSGPVHIACATGVPVIAIFGRNDRGLSPERWGPMGKNDIVLHKDVGCDICMAHNCRIGFKCLDAITVGEVVSAAERLLSPA